MGGSAAFAVWASSPTSPSPIWSIDGAPSGGWRGWPAPSSARSGTMSAPRSPSGRGGAPGRTWLWLITLVLLILEARLLSAGALHLTEDEAYYRLWAQAPALGYFDHP